MVETMLKFGSMQQKKERMAGMIITNVCTRQKEWKPVQQECVLAKIDEVKRNAKDCWETTLIMHMWADWDSYIPTSNTHFDGYQALSAVHVPSHLGNVETVLICNTLAQGRNRIIAEAGNFGRQGHARG
jgi:hypothetical protein